ncbi:hypothetical protein QTG54_003498 [Skeletonema marinoi]|uniref:Uncharacterized protein n=1 Tax=Skeletonema marinoi TaxID=267567 RepID=A0AAD9DGV2_9STRA|nr:hypothetical protein QTG54_003498 [Skeletonema marinoi]
MSDAQSQLAEVDALIAASPEEPSLLQLREDLLQLIALEEQELQHDQQQIGEQHSLDHQHVEDSNEQQSSENYTAQSTFTDNVGTSNSLAEAPDLGSFQPVAKSSHKYASSAIVSQANLKSGDDNEHDEISTAVASSAPAAAAQPTEKKKKKKKKSEESSPSTTFELPNHLIPLDSDTDAQRQKKHRAAKSLKSKFRAKQKEKEQAKRANDWKSFASKTSKKKKKVGGKSIFSTEEGVNAKVGVMRGGR